MKKITTILVVFISIFFITYLLLPNPSFPEPPLDALQSNEPADTEDVMRRAYFTNYNREEVMEHYKSEFEKPVALGWHIPSYRLNYPPEEANVIIRDRTRSTFLEEIVHPLRESVYVNGFKPVSEKDAIFIEGKEWNQKITVRLVSSASLIRVVIALVTLLLVAILTSEWGTSIKGIFNQRKKQ